MKIEKRRRDGLIRRRPEEHLRRLKDNYGRIRKIVPVNKGVKRPLTIKEKRIIRKREKRLVRKPAAPVTKTSKKQPWIKIFNGEKQSPPSFSDILHVRRFLGFHEASDKEIAEGHPVHAVLELMDGRKIGLQLSVFNDLGYEKMFIALKERDKPFNLMVGPGPKGLIYALRMKNTDPISTISEGKITLEDGDGGPLLIPNGDSSSEVYGLIAISMPTKKDLEIFKKWKQAGSPKDRLPSFGGCYRAGLVSTKPEFLIRLNNMLVSEGYDTTEKIIGLFNNPDKLLELVQKHDLESFIFMGKIPTEYYESMYRMLKYVNPAGWADLAGRIGKKDAVKILRDSMIPFILHRFPGSQLLLETVNEAFRRTGPSHDRLRKLLKNVKPKKKMTKREEFLRARTDKARGIIFKDLKSKSETLNNLAQDVALTLGQFYDNLTEKQKLQYQKRASLEGKTIVKNESTQKEVTDYRKPNDLFGKLDDIEDLERKIKELQKKIKSLGLDFEFEKSGASDTVKELRRLLKNG